MRRIITLLILLATVWVAPVAVTGLQPTEPEIRLSSDVGGYFVVEWTSDSNPEMWTISLYHNKLYATIEDIRIFNNRRCKDTRYADHRPMPEIVSNRLKVSGVVHGESREWHTGKRIPTAHDPVQQWFAYCVLLIPRTAGVSDPVIMSRYYIGAELLMSRDRPAIIPPLVQSVPQVKDSTNTIEVIPSPKIDADRFDLLHDNPYERRVEWDLNSGR